MITRQHCALTFMVYAAHRKETKVFQEVVPWLLLPDAIRFFSKGRQVSHFEEAITGEVAYMEFPSAEVLKSLKSESFADSVAMYLPTVGFPQCVIGERTRVDVFDNFNFEHPYYSTLRIHLVQDIALDELVRHKMVDAQGRFSNRFRIIGSSKCINGKTLRDQIALFESAGFFYLAGKIYKDTGVLLDNDWLEANVHEPLYKAYPEDMAENTWRYIELNEAENERMKSMQFDVTASENAQFIFGRGIEYLLNELYAYAYFNSEAWVF